MFFCTLRNNVSSLFFYTSLNFFFCDTDLYGVYCFSHSLARLLRLLLYYYYSEWFLYAFGDLILVPRENTKCEKKENHERNVPIGQSCRCFISFHRTNLGGLIRHFQRTCGLYFKIKFQTVKGEIVRYSDISSPFHTRSKRLICTIPEHSSDGKRKQDSRERLSQLTTPAKCVLYCDIMTPDTQWDVQDDGGGMFPIIYVGLFILCPWSRRISRFPARYSEPHEPENRNQTK